MAGRVIKQIWSQISFYLDYKKAFDVTLNFNYTGALYMNIERRGVYKMITVSVRLLPLPIDIFSLVTNIKLFKLVTKVLPR